MAATVVSNGKSIRNCYCCTKCRELFYCTSFDYDKAKSLLDKPIAEWGTEFTKNWDPKRDFAYAMLHSERLIRLLINEAIAEILLAQAKRWPERRDYLERFLDRAEVQSRHLADEITTSGSRFLERLAERRGGEASAKAS